MNEQEYTNYSEKLENLNIQERLILDMFKKFIGEDELTLKTKNYLNEKLIDIDRSKINLRYRYLSSLVKLSERSSTLKTGTYDEL